MFFIIIIIGVSFILYSLYLYYRNSKNFHNYGYTFLPEDLVNEKPVLREENIFDIDECKRICNNNPTCAGITYDTENNVCIGTENGIIRPDDDKFISWKKKTFDKTSDLTKIVKLGFTNSSQVLSRTEFQKPSLLNNCLYSFWININDWYENYGYWKHIFHKGTNVDYQMNFKEWGEIVDRIPEQYIGVWLNPYHNNMRICITTEKINVKQKPNNNNNQHPNIDLNNKHNSNIHNINNVKQIEYYDLTNLPINKLINVSVVIVDNFIEIYKNSKLIKTLQLKGNPSFNNDNVFVKNNKSFNGGIYNLIYNPSKTNLNDIHNIYINEPNI